MAAFRYESVRGHDNHFPMNPASSRRIFRVHDDDNVGVLLVDASASDTFHLPGLGERLTLNHDIPLGHKLALCMIEPEAAVLKFGVRIGHATQTIRPGDWVHLHNCASDYDERSGTLDGETGAPTDVVYE
jgi:altronate dehydratase small subunit